MPDSTLEAKVQSDGARSFADAWGGDLLKQIESQTAAALSA